MASANIHDYIAPGRRAHLVGIGGVSNAVGYSLTS